MLENTEGTNSLSAVRQIAKLCAAIEADTPVSRLHLILNQIKTVSRLALEENRV